MIHLVTRNELGESSRDEIFWVNCGRCPSHPFMILTEGNEDKIIEMSKNIKRRDIVNF